MSIETCNVSFTDCKKQHNLFQFCKPGGHHHLVSIILIGLASVQKWVQSYKTYQTLKISIVLLQVLVQCVCSTQGLVAEVMHNYWCLSNILGGPDLQIVIPFRADGHKCVCNSNC